MKIRSYSRREFLKVAGVSIAAVAVSRTISITNVLGDISSTGTSKLPTPIRGIVSVGSRPRAGVAVSDGFDVVLTDAKGRYKLPNKKADAPFVFVVQPDDVAKSSTAFYRMPFQLQTGQKKIDFALLPAAAGQSMTKARFVQITDIHTTDEARGQLQERGLEEIYKLGVPADFIMATGDLVDHWGKTEELSNYMAAAKNSPVAHFNVIGNHDVDKTPDAAANYRRYLGPDYYSFDQGGVHFVILNSITSSDRQKAWFEKDLAMPGKGKPVIVFQHYPPTSEELRRLDELNIHSIFTGHWHSERVVKSERTISVSSPSFNMGGIDFSPAGFKVVDIASDGSMRTQWRPAGVSKWAKLVWSAGGACEGLSKIIANLYDSSIDAEKVRFAIRQNGQLKVLGELKQQSPLNWMGSLPASIELENAEVEIEVDGQPDWKTKGNFTISGCSAAIKADDNWPMFMGNPAHTGLSGSKLSLPPSLAWSENTGGDVDLSSPILSDGKLFVAVKARRSDAFTGVLSIEPATGKIIWRFQTQQSINHSPACEAGVICAVEVGGRVYGASSETGKELWRHDLGDNIGRWIYGAPAADDGKFYVGSVNRFARIDAKTGRADWEKSLAVDGPVEKAGYSNDWISSPVSPAISGRFLAMGGFWTRGDNLFVVDKTSGEKIWSHPADRGMHSSPTIAGDKILFFGKESLLHCCNLADGKTIWTKQIGRDPSTSLVTSWSATTPAVKDDIVIAGSGDGVMAALRLSDGSEIWTHKSGQSIFRISPYRTDNASILSSPTIADDKVFFSSADGKLYCLDFNTGRELWSFDFGVPVLSTPLVSGNAIFTAAYDGRVYAFSGERNKEKIATLTGRKRNENCNWQRPCRFYLQRDNQGVFGRSRSHS